MVRPAVPDPIDGPLWVGFHASYGWDVGANCGQSIGNMEQVCAKFTCFEPCEDSFLYARQAYPFSDIRQLAVSDRNGYIALAYPADEQKETGQLVTIGTKGMEWEPADWAEVETVEVPARTADSLALELGIPAFVKVDTEGHEVSVMEGADGLVRRGKTSWLIEFHTPQNQVDISTFLKRNGYEPHIVRHPNYPEGSDMWHQHGWLRAFAVR